jgi:hypothetical protein
MAKPLRLGVAGVVVSRSGAMLIAAADDDHHAHGDDSARRQHEAGPGRGTRIFHIAAPAVGPGVAWTRQARDDGSLHPRSDRNDRQDREPA